jgi:NADPH-dependent 2,4-dienoyl-CoA reductase/sulfur reductase-like enzyme
MERKRRSAMTPLSRRKFLIASGIGLGLLGAEGLRAFAAETAPGTGPKKGRRVVVIGGGWGGATAAKYVRLADPSIEVILLEPNKQFISCPFSNLVLSGVESIKRLTMGYDRLKRHGVKIRHEAASAVDPEKKQVRVGKDTIEYDRLIVSPGIDFLWDQIEGLEAAKDTVLHAWKAGPQTVELANQLQAMPDGGVFVLSQPLAAYRCPPGPYERACQVAWYLKNKKPRSKLIFLDANKDVVSKGALFKAAWKDYPLEYRPASKVEKIDTSTREVTTEIGDKVKYDVINVIPPQRAGAIAVQADLVGADKRWCEVNHVTYESVKHKDIHVLGDATIGLPVPKSGTVANNMGKICAIAVVQLLNGKEVTPLAPLNVCYSWVNDREAIAVINSYKVENGKVVQIEAKLTPGQSEVFGRHARDWARGIWNDILG